MRVIKSRFSSKCTACGDTIPKGINIYYDPATRKAYHMACGPGAIADDKASNDEKAVSEMIRDQEDAAYDNFCQFNNI